MLELVKYKNIRIAKRGGGTRTQRVRVLASGKYRFVKNTTKSRSPRKSPKRKTSRKVKRVGKKKRRSGGKNMTQTVFKLVRWGALAAPGISAAVAPGLSAEQKLHRAVAWYTGYYIPTGEWKAEHLAKGWLPYLGAVLTTYGIPKITSIIRRM